MEAITTGEDLKVITRQPDTCVTVLGEPKAAAIVLAETTAVRCRRQPKAGLATIEAGPQGPPGPPGPAGGDAIERRAGHALSALRAVWEDGQGRVHYLSADDGDHIFRLVGVTLTAADEGWPVNVQCRGAMEDDAWSWTPGQRVYLGTDGSLVATPTEDGFHVLIGVALSPTRLNLCVQDPIFLESN